MKSVGITRTDKHPNIFQFHEICNNKEMEAKQVRPPVQRSIESKQVRPPIQRSATTDLVTEEESEPPVPKPNDNSRGTLRKSFSMDSGEAEFVKKSVTGSCIRRIVRRRRLGRPEPNFGHDTETYKKIRERVLQERAVTNAIDALQERWKMIIVIFDNFVKLNEERRERKLKKLSIQRQFELTMVVSVFLLICLPISVIFVLLNG